MDHPERLAGALQYLELQLATYEQQHLQQKGLEFNVLQVATLLQATAKN